MPSSLPIFFSPSFLLFNFSCLLYSFVSFCPVFLISFLLFFLPFILFPSLVLSSFNFFFLPYCFLLRFISWFRSFLLPYSFIFLILYFFLPSIYLSFYLLVCLSSFVYSFLYSFLPSLILFMFFLPSTDLSSRDLYKQYSCTYANSSSILLCLLFHLFLYSFFPSFVFVPCTFIPFPLLFQLFALPQYVNEILGTVALKGQKSLVSVTGDGV